MKKHDWKILYALQDAEIQISYLRSRLNPKEFSFTSPTCEETLNKIKEAKELLPVKIETLKTEKR